MNTESLREEILQKMDESNQLYHRLTLVVGGVQAGFKKAWQERDYDTIIEVAKKIPENVLQEDSGLLMWYDRALTRTGGE